MKLLSIVVLSYNRPKQIKRILEKFIGVKSNDYDLIIKDDCSPKIKNIEKLVSDNNAKIGIEVLLYKNESNLGYDLNLLDAFNITNSEYILLLSDDDYIIADKINDLIFTMSRQRHNLYYLPYSKDDIVYRNNSAKYNFKKFSSYIYNSVLFSGLIFNRRKVLQLELDTEFISNCIYTQVYIAVKIIYHDEHFGIGPEGIIYLGGDGDNYFGKNESAKFVSMLNDREDISSNLKYQQFFIEVVKKVSDETSKEIYRKFKKEYNKRLLGYITKARSKGINSYFTFIKSYNEIVNDKQTLIYCFLIIAVFLPRKITESLYSFGKNKFKNSG